MTKPECQFIGDRSEPAHFPLPKVRAHVLWLQRMEWPYSYLKLVLTRVGRWIRGRWIKHLKRRTFNFRWWTQYSVHIMYY